MIKIIQTLNRGLGEFHEDPFRDDLVSTLILEKIIWFQLQCLRVSFFPQLVYVPATVYDPADNGRIIPDDPCKACLRQALVSDGRPQFYVDLVHHRTPLKSESTD